MIYKSSEGKQQIITYYENIIKNWPAQNENIMVDTSYGKTFVIASGSKQNPPIILLHGSSTNSAMWMGEIEYLNKNHRVYAIDIIGEAGKSDENRPNMKDVHYGKWLDEVINNLNIKKPILIGYSLGGWMAIKYATYKPEKISKLILLATSGIVQAKISFFIKIIPLMLIGKKGFYKTNKIVYNNTTMPKPVLDFGYLVFKYYKPRGFVPLFSDEELSRLTMSTLYIGGENDALLYSKKSANRLNNLLPNSKTIILENTGHIITNIYEHILFFL